MIALTSPRGRCEATWKVTAEGVPFLLWRARLGARHRLVADADGLRRKDTRMNTEKTAETNEQAETNDPEHALTQADVDRIVKDRVARERAKFADYDELKQAAARLAEIEEAQKTETQKAQEAAAAAQAELEALRTRLRTQAIETAVTTAAAAAGAINPQQVLRLIDLDGVEPAEDGSIDLGDRVTEFLASNQHLVKGAAAAAPALPAAPGTATSKGTQKALTVEEIAALTPEQLAKDPSLLAQVLAARDAVR